MPDDKIVENIIEKAINEDCPFCAIRLLSDYCYQYPEKADEIRELGRKHNIGCPVISYDK